MFTPTDFTFTSFEFGPSIVSQSYSIILIDDRIPEPAKNYDIVLVNVTSAREGVLPPVIQPGSARVRIYDNDCKSKFHCYRRLQNLCSNR